MVVIDSIRWDDQGMAADSFDLIQYGCDGENRVLLDRLRIEGELGQVGLAKGELDHLEQVVNARLRARQGCTCR